MVLQGVDKRKIKVDKLFELRFFTVYPRYCVLCVGTQGEISKSGEYLSKGYDYLSKGAVCLSTYFYFRVSIYVDGETQKHLVKQRVKYFGSLKPTR